MNHRKSPTIALVIAIIPGFGHLYIGAYKRALLVFGVIFATFILQVWLIDPIFVQPITRIFGEKSLINRLVSTLFSLPFWSYGWQFRDVYLRAEEIAHPNSKKILLTRKP